MKLLKTPEQHAEALERIGRLAARGEQLTESQQDELEVLIALTQKYEKETQPIGPPTPLEAIKFRMEQMGYTRRDLAALLGGESRVSEIFAGRRSLSTAMMRRLRDEWGIPADSLLGGTSPDPDPSAPDPGAEGARNPKDYPMKQMFDRDALDGNFMRWLAGLSGLAEGPRLACEALEEKGIAVIIEAHLDQTHLDGAAMLGTGGRPLIGLTLRHNRLDNFWFTLFHEIAHVRLHLSIENPAILDLDIDHQKKPGTIEAEADRFALDTLIPPDVWRDHVRHLQYADEIRAAAKRLCVHPAVIAGRLRREANDYRKHPTLIGSGETRAALGFTEKDWPK